MGLHCKIVDENNLDEILKLKITQGQKNQVESVKDCLKEAQEIPCWNSIGIYDGNVAIGFGMYGFWENEGVNGRLWLDRFLIDENFQGKGYAREAIRVSIDRMKMHYNVDEIFLSVIDENIPAVRLYKEYGFEFNGEFDINGEKIMFCKLI